MEESLDTYHPRFIRDQINIESKLRKDSKTDEACKSQTSRWLPRLASSSGLSKLTERLARLSSLDSTRSTSSIEADIAVEDNLDQQTGRISLNDPGPSRSLAKNDNLSSSSQQNYNKMVGDEDEIDDEDDDQFQSMPKHNDISSSPFSHRDDRENFRQKTSKPDLEQNSYDYLLDDRQGMNSGEQQFTKAERANRNSLDGSIISETRDSSIGKKNSIVGKGAIGSKKLDKLSRKGKSGSRRSRHSRRGLFGLASRLKLTRKYEPIATFQLYILNSGFISLKKLDRDLQSFLPRGRMTPKELDEHMKLFRKYPVLVKIEYKFASRYETYVCRHATQESNLIKNNYKKCIPYDYNRVVLKTIPNVPNSDYINASHVDSYLKPNAYIAAQGPNENTIEDFWRMVWEQKSFVIVMLTKVFDFIKVMCNQYWPVEKNKPERYGNLEVTLIHEEPLADFVIRTIRLTRLRPNQANESEQPNIDATGPKSNDEYQNSKNEPKYFEDTSDGLSDEDEIVFNVETELGTLDKNEPQSTQSNPMVPKVRKPKFISVPKINLRRRSISADDLATTDFNEKEIDRSSKQTRLSGLHNLRLDSTAPIRARSSSFREQTDKQNLLHPSFGLTSASQFGGSSSSLISVPNTPTTPVTPNTPNSGIDRSSATRRAVKKKRRTRTKDGRPMRTEFLVPDEDQLMDDDDDDVVEIPSTAATYDQWGRPLDGANTRQTSERIIYQFHYHSWASHTCPFISSLLHFRRRVRICMDEMSKSGKTGPTIVHCNDGCGRTGTYLCIDANLELADEDSLYDVFNYTKKLRQSRKFLIENLEQYRFVYDTIEEALFCGKTWFPISELHQKLKHKSQRNSVTQKNEYQIEYEKICRMTSKFSIGDCAGGHRVENREKNRDVSTVPPDNFRPYLTSFQTNDSTDYINAVFVDGYTRSKEYIVTEWPLHKTISDFWSLIYDHDCNSVILLANPGESSAHPSFLPSEKELRRKFGPVFSAEMVSYTHYQNIKSWIYTINKKIVSLTEVIAGVKSEAKTTQVFQITCWPQGHRVPTSTNALVELMNMVERWRQRTAYGPVCVVSLNGKSRAGVYCAANVAIEQVVQHGEVDVFQAVKTVRRHRPQLIENMTEYKYCYDLILHYVLHYLNQSSSNARDSII